tara:strand:- start:253 stop:594 length:342 start_codon:yes stop_codon:yes gene_type:complete
LKKSLNDATPEEWDNIHKPKTVTGQMFTGYPNKKETSNRIFDPVNKPSHYNKGGIEAIDYIKQQLGKDFKHYCAGNVMKYLHRYSYKNGVEDLRKAGVYLEWLIAEVEHERNR